MNPKGGRAVLGVLFVFLCRGEPAAGEPGGGLKENLDLPYDAGGQSGEEEEDAPDLIVFWGQVYEGDGVFFCCDQSESMTGAPLERLQKEIIEAIHQLSESAEFGIVLFDSKFYQFPPTGKPATATAAMKAAGEGWIRSARPGSCSCYKDALFATLRLADQSTVRRKLMILLGDGHVFCPGYARAEYAAETLRAVTERNCHRIPINTICIGGGLHGADEEWMRQLAAQNGGRYARIHTSN